MNQTKKITHGAMLLAIVGAILLIDRYFLAFYFDEMVFLMQALCIILYACKYTIKDGFVISIGILVLTFLFGGLSSYVYVFVAILGGLSYAYGIKKGLDRRLLLLLISIVFILGEVMATVVVMPIMGIPFDTLISESEELMNAMPSLSLLNMTDGFKHTFILVTVIVSLILLGVLEGILVHFVSKILLSRFHILELNKVPADKLIMPIWLTYALIVPVFLTFAIRYLNEDSILIPIILVLSFISMIIFYFFGIIFIFLFGMMKYHRNFSFISVILSFLVPPFLLMVVVLGFLYSSGPLYRYLFKGGNNNGAQ